MVSSRQSAGMGPDRAAGQSGNSILGSIIEVVVIVAAAFLLALLIQQFVVKPFYIPSPSMRPTLMEGDRVLVSRFIYRFQEPQRGDIVVFHPPRNEEQDYIKRVVGLAGDRVAVKEGKLYVNGQVQVEPYLQEQQIKNDYAEITIPPDSVFVMGDNRNNSGDSRFFGPVAVDEIVGESFLIYWPLTKLDWL